MSILSSLFRQIIRAFESAVGLIFPARCIVCDRRIKRRGQMMCARCQVNIPITRFAVTPENPMTQRAKALLPHIVHASALVYYSHQNGWREMIHRLKYAGDHRLGVDMGVMLGRELAKSPIYQDIDFVVAVPLHPLRRIVRGYNQSYYIARAVARELGIPCRLGLLRRKRYNVSQVKVNRNRRWENTREIFSVVRPSAFVEKRVLLIDDVFTTGATTISCAETIINSTPSCKLWIAAVAVSESEFGLEPRV